MKGKINWLEVLLWIMMIVIFIMILSRIFGNSATDIQVYLGFASILVVIMGYISRLNREVGEVKVGIKHSFDKIKEDVGLIKKKLKI